MNFYLQEIQNYYQHFDKCMLIYSIYISLTKMMQCSYLSQIQPLLLIGRLQLLQLMCSVVDAWFRQVMALHVLNLMTSLDTFHNSNRCSRSM